MISESDIAAQLIERLLTDPAFRAQFRRDPAAACRDAGLHDLADEMALGAGNAMMTLDVRESKSSLAGVMMAAAMEGVGIFQFAQHVAPALGDVGNPLGDVLSRVNLPAVSLPGRGALSGGAPAAAPAVPGKEAPEAAAPAAPSPAAPAPEPAAGARPEAALPEAPPPAEEEAPAPVSEAPELPSAPPLPEPEMGPAAPAAERAVVDHTTAAGRAGATPIPADAGQAAPSRPPDPDEYGREGTGGPMTPEVKALLENPNVKFDEVGIADLKAGKIDPRAIAVLTKLSQEHEITVTCMCSDHPRGPGSNHYYGRGIDIGSIDGEIVRPGSAAARELAGEIAELSASLKPTEVGTPFAIASPGYFTDAAHQDHIHLGWDDPITPDWKPPADLAAPTAPAPTAPGVPAPPAGDSGAFMAVTAEAASRSGGGGGVGADSGSFLAVPEPAPATASSEPPPTAVTGSEQIDLSTVGDAYPGDDAPKEQLAAWLAREAEKRGLPPQLPVMAALVESGVRNLNHGHADSVGFFQMRVGIWNRGEYAGFPEKPELQAKWFLDTAEQVKKQRLAAGKPIDDPAHFGEWVADVERPAEQYRGRYQLRLQEANNLLKQASGSSAPGPATPAAPAPATPAAPAPATPAPAAAAPPPPPPPPPPAPPEPGRQRATAGDSGSFLAVSASAEARSGNGGGGGDSGSFLAVPAPDPAPPPPPVPAPVLPAVDDAARSFDPDLAAIDPEYPGDDAPKDQIAKWMAKEAKARGIPPELPVMAALVESNLTNLDYGHSTSLGYFQMLEHLWNKGEYAGYPDNPRLQLKWFLDTAEQVKAQRVAAGRPIDDPREFGEWIADVERPAEQYRGRYQLRLAEARKLLQ